MVTDHEFQGRVALVTGGSRGIGRAVALRLARGGADVALSYASRKEDAARTAGEIEGLGRRAAAFQCDASKPEEVQRLVDETRKALGPIDLLAHAGAISNLARHEELTWERWKETIEVNLNGAFLVLFAVKDEMIRRGFGRAVLFSSIAALRPRKLQIHYSASKAGVIALVRSSAEAFAPHNVRVNCIAPGLIDTEMAQVLSPELIERIKGETPMGRMGTAEELAELAAFLLSERSSFMTGETVCSSGGRVTLP
jgi:3-oxoacyl-[acyl-carrier protein] reductase